MRRILFTFLFVNIFSFANSQGISKDSVDNKIYTFVDKSAEFPGGIEKLYHFLGRNIQYPKDARRNAVQGKVFVKFVIEPDGSITNVEVVKGVNSDLDNEATRVIQTMPNWIPAERSEQKVRQAYTLPISFKLGR